MKPVKLSVWSNSSDTSMILLRKLKLQTGIGGLSSTTAVGFANSRKLFFSFLMMIVFKLNKKGMNIS